MTTPDISTPRAAEPEKGASAEEVQADIERTRAALGDTVEQLVDTFDVKAQARQRVDEARRRAQHTASEARLRTWLYLNRARACLLDDENRPTRAGWVAVSAAATTAGIALAASAMRSRR